MGLCDHVVPAYQNFRANSRKSLLGESVVVRRDDRAEPRANSFEEAIVKVLSLAKRAGFPPKE